jgi:hypothetical protein
MFGAVRPANPDARGAAGERLSDTSYSEKLRRIRAGDIAMQQ